MSNHALDANIVEQICTVFNLPFEGVSAVDDVKTQVEFGNLGMGQYIFGGGPRQSDRLRYVVAIAPVQRYLENWRIARLRSGRTAETTWSNGVARCE